MLTLQEILFESGSMDSNPEKLERDSVIIDGVFYLNPDGAEDRRNFMEAQSLVTDVKFTRVKGPYYSEKQLQEVYEHLGGLAIGTINCGLGHLRIINQAYKLGLSTICVFEDDVFVNENLKEDLLECTRQLNNFDPEWKMCLLAHPEWFKFENGYTPPKGKVTEYLSHGGEVWGMGAYLISRHGMEVFKEQYQHHTQLVAIDNISYHMANNSYLWKLDRPPREHAARYHRLDVHGNIIASNNFFFGSIRSTGV